jgi:pyruvate ferredoxin oxidoreductase alpha subunit
MLRISEGCHAIAQTIAMCRPELICAYSANPQARIIDRLAEMAKAGELANCEFINVDSEFAAMSVAMGASAAGARTYTATASPGLLQMAEALYGAAGLGLPIVMTVSNCAADAQTSSWNDHSASMPMRDAGWIQLYAETDQEAVDLHVQAFRIAEALSCPVMVCVDGTVPTHALEPAEVPSQVQVDAYLPPLERQLRDPGRIAGIGMISGPDAFMEMRYLAHHKQLRALSLIPQLSGEFSARFGRPSGGLLRTYRTEDAETIVVALGSVNLAIREVVDQLRDAHLRIGSVTLGSFRPFPLCALRDVLQMARRVVVLEKSLAVGLGGILSDGVRKCSVGLALITYTVIAGLGGRAVTQASLKQLFEDAAQDELEQVTFLDLNADFIARQLENGSRTGRPAAETLWT